MDKSADEIVLAEARATAHGVGPRSPKLRMFGMPKSDGWPIERVVNLMAGTVVIVTLSLGCELSKRWRLITGFVDVNLIMDATVGWCPSSVILHHLRVPTAAERGKAS